MKYPLPEMVQPHVLIRSSLLAVDWILVNRCSDQLDLIISFLVEEQDDKVSLVVLTGVQDKPRAHWLVSSTVLC